MTLETANRLFELRKKHNLSQEELAEKLGVSRQAVSKWERSEASPDTDNLIALAKIYGLSLDELVYGKKSEEAKEDTESKADRDENQENIDDDNFEETFTNDNSTRVKIGNGHIYVKGEDGDEVKIKPNGIFVKSEDGEKVKIDLSGIKITEGKHIHINCDDDDDYDDDDGDDESEECKAYNASFWRKLPYPIICVIAYLTFGCLDILGGFGQSWIVFTTIPLYYTIVKAIYVRKFAAFSYPIFTAFAYLFCGMYLNNWHPSWIIFITIPVYYYIANAIDKKLKKK